MNRLKKPIQLALFIIAAFAFGLFVHDKWMAEPTVGIATQVVSPEAVQNSISSNKMLWEGILIGVVVLLIVSSPLRKIFLYAVDELVHHMRRLLRRLLPPIWFFVALGCLYFWYTDPVAAQKIIDLVHKLLAEKWKNVGTGETVAAQMTTYIVFFGTLITPLLMFLAVLSVSPRKRSNDDFQWPLIGTLLLAGNGFPIVIAFNLFLLTKEAQWLGPMYDGYLLPMAGSEPGVIAQGLFLPLYFGIALISLVLFFWLQTLEIKTGEGAAFTLFGAWLAKSDRRKGWYAKLPLIMSYEKLETRTRNSSFGWRGDKVEPVGFPVDTGLDNVENTVFGGVDWAPDDIITVLNHKKHVEGKETGALETIHERLKEVVQESLRLYALDKDAKTFQKTKSEIAKNEGEWINKKELRDAARKFGVKILRVTVKNINPPAALNAAWEQIQVEVAEKSAYLIEAEGMAQQIEVLTKTGMKPNEARKMVLANQKKADLVIVEGFENATFVGGGVVPNLTNKGSKESGGGHGGGRGHGKKGK